MIPPQPAAPVALARGRSAAADAKARAPYAIACLVIHLLAIAACAKMGALRVPDLAVSMGVLAICYTLAIRDSGRLPSFILIVWVFSRLIRRLVDWRMGGFESLTALSLLPMLATLTIVIPTIPRLGKLPFGLQQTFFLIVAPIGFATVLGLASYGPVTVVEAANWGLPVLLAVYLALRDQSATEGLKMTRSCVVIATVAAVYAWYQFLLLPSWDRMWLIQSGMTSSMGQPYPLQVRVWGPMSSTGPAAAVWAAASVLALTDKKWKSPFRGFGIAACTTALLLTRVRSCWITAVAGLIIWSMLQGKRSASSLAAVGVVVVALLFVGPMLPGGELISDRLESLSDLQNDSSFRERKRFSLGLIDSILENPMGAGLGYKSQGKLAGDGKLAAFDNGFGEVFFALGLFGGFAWTVGVVRMLHWLYRRSQQAELLPAELGRWALSLFLMSLIALASSYFLGGTSGVVCWLVIGIAITSLKRNKARLQPVAAPPLPAERTGP